MGGACAESAKGHTEKCTFEFWNVILAMNLQRSIQWEGGPPPPKKNKQTRRFCVFLPPMHRHFFSRGQFHVTTGYFIHFRTKLERLHMTSHLHIAFSRAESDVSAVALYHIAGIFSELP